MDPTDRIASEYDRLVAMGRDGVASCPQSERFVFCAVSTRCEIDINGFDSVFEQGLTADELLILIDGLNLIHEPHLALEFRRGFDLLDAQGFYQHLNWNHVAQEAKNEIDAIGDRVGDQLWQLDDKMAKLLDGTAEVKPEE
jgi:hypothetical protein